MKKSFSSSYFSRRWSFSSTSSYLPDRTINIIGAELPEVGEPAGIIVFNPVIFREPFFIQGVERVPYRIQVDTGACSKVFIAILPFAREPFNEVEPFIFNQTVKISTYCGSFSRSSMGSITVCIVGRC